jgi:hypothetical protein
LVSLSWKEGPAIKGLLNLVLLCLWIIFGMLAGFLLIRISWIAVYAWAIGNLSLACILNIARKHSKENMFDDRLTTERMDDAENRYIEESLQIRDNEAQKEQQKNKTEK